MTDDLISHLLEPLLILLQQSASRLDIDQNLQRHREVSLRQHGFLVLN